MGDQQERRAQPCMVLEQAGDHDPARIIKRLVLPDPDGPTSATVSPGSMRSETPRRMSTGPAALGRVSEALSSSTSGLAGPLSAKATISTTYHCEERHDEINLDHP